MRSLCYTAFLIGTSFLCWDSLGYSHDPLSALCVTNLVMSSLVYHSSIELDRCSYRSRTTGWR